MAQFSGQFLVEKDDASTSGREAVPAKEQEFIELVLPARVYIKPVDDNVAPDGSVLETLESVEWSLGFVAVADPFAGAHTISLFQLLKLEGAAPIADIPLTPTVTFAAASPSVSGVGTAFLSEVLPGDLIQLDADGIFHEVLSVASDIALTLTTPYSGTGGSGASTRRRPNEIQVPTRTLAAGSTGWDLLPVWWGHDTHPPLTFKSAVMIDISGTGTVRLVTRIIPRAQLRGF